ncbi:MAG TPA: bifunctional phosphoglucose/phosphomannose isomerase, partial [Cyclobacteriaceae bacterium]|nr:bifunctional phosphoglucose/phosphomannose isomerase [Cyclobacteriaceae bacterium]
VMLAGMGGSGIGANLIESLTFDRIPFPISICKGYEIPRFVDPHTLFIASSYSGNTEEVLEAVNKARLKRANIIVITSGGKLLEIAEANNYPVFKVPSGSDSPRANIGYMMLGLLFVFYQAGLIGAAFIKETENAIDYLNRGVKAIQTEAEILARRLKGKFPIIYSGPRMAAMATRFQQQLNENAKQLAHVNTFPEMNHNEIVGWKFPEHLFQHAQVICLYSDYDNERVEKRMEICWDIFEKKSGTPIDIVAQGASLLEEYFYLIHLTDWITFYLAKENHVDVNAIDNINFLKNELSKIK